MDKLKDKLMTFEKEKLVEFLLYLMDSVSERERVNFISKNIDNKIALEKGLVNLNVGFLKEVKEFCCECENGDHLVYEDYDGIELEDSLWAKNFTHYLDIAIIHSRAGEHKFALDIFDRVFHVIYEAEEDCEILGSEDPLNNFDINIDDVFTEYFKSIIGSYINIHEALQKIFTIYLRYSYWCNDAMVNSLEDTSKIEKLVREEYILSCDFDTQENLYELIKKLYERDNLHYNKEEFINSFLPYNYNFYSLLVKSFLEDRKYKEVIDYGEKALNLELEEYLHKDILRYVSDAYLKLDKKEEAVMFAKKLFYKEANYNNYKLVRSSLDSEEKINEFKEEVIYKIKNKYLTLRILSYEGDQEHLVDMYKQVKVSKDYYELKYLVKSIIYAGFKDKVIREKNLMEFYNNILLEREDGIVDMLKPLANKEVFEKSMLKVIEILKGFVEFHIEATTRSRYVKAAYYCGALKNISEIIGRKEEFISWYENIMTVNKRKTALKEEMSNKFS